MIRPRTARRLILRHIQALARPNLNSTESVEAVQHVGTYIRVVACSLDDVRGGVVHGNGSGRGHRVARLTTLVNKCEDVKTFLKLFWVVFVLFGSVWLVPRPRGRFELWHSSNQPLGLGTSHSSNQPLGLGTSQTEPNSTKTTQNSLRKTR